VKLSKIEEKLLLDMGYLQQDIMQIKSLRYKFTLYSKNTNENISLETAKQLLSQNDFLSGIGRATFHCTAFRSINNSDNILIESNLL